MITTLDQTQTRFAKVPAALKALNQWVCWRYETIDGKRTKVPYSPSNRKASTTEKTTWNSFDKCLRAVAHFDGIGIVFANGLSGIDLDHHIENGTLDPLACEIVDSVNTYTELSPSGEGIHCLAFGALPEGKRRDDSLGLEMYSSGRFFTVTGNHIADTPLTVETRSAELAAIHNKYLCTASEPKHPAQAKPNNLDDEATLARAFNSKNGEEVRRLYDGDLSAHNQNHSDADLALCNHLAFWTGGDEAKIDRLFRDSGLMRPKWDERHSSDGRTYGQMTIAKALANIANYYVPRTNGNRQNGSQHTNKTPSTESKASDAESKKRITSTDYLAALAEMGYSFRLNELDDSIEVIGKPLTDPLRSVIRSQIRDKGFRGMEALEDAYTAEAYKNRFHPIKDYLQSLQWDGKPHIAGLAEHFENPDGALSIFLRRWLIGAVAKAMTGEQNPMLVFDGRQGIGKSRFARWLCPLPEYFIEAPINPEDKDSGVRLMSRFIWEVSELGSTVRRADRESLKAFISQQTVTVRKPYGRMDMTKPALASMIGTVNNESGILSDPTGSRRFLVCRIEKIYWSYEQMDVSQVWAEAVHAYDEGESWNLAGDEIELSQQINGEYEIDDPVAAMICKYLKLEKESNAWTSSLDILTTLESFGLRGNTKSNFMAIASAMTRLGYKKSRRLVQEKQVPGYGGVSRM